jgi:hypothetical protein
LLARKSDIERAVREHGHGYIVGRNRRRSGEVFDFIQSATGPWIECPVGITAREKATPPKTLVQEVASKEPGVRVFVVHSEERAAFECRHRAKAMDRVRVRLEKLQRRVAEGRLNAPEKIGAAAARILARNHGHRYYDWAHQDGVFRFFEHPVHFTREQAYEGKYVIQTEEQNLSAVDAVRLYKELSDVKRAFADLKDVLDMRPIYHQIDSRVQAHLCRRTRLPAPPRDRKKAQGRPPRSFRHRSLDGAQGRPRGRYRPSATAPPSDPSQPAPIAPPQCCAPSASAKSILQPHHQQVKPCCSDKPHSRL